MVGNKLKAAYEFWRYYRVVILFPTFTVSTITADLIHTRNWKRQLQLGEISPAAGHK